MSEPTNKQEKLQEMHRQYMVLLADIDDDQKKSSRFYNDMQEKLSRLRKQILEDDKEVVEKLDKAVN